MAISQVITFGGSPDQLVWKYGNENITTTSQLIVDETHEALLVVNGNAADLFGPGTRTLELPNIPLVNKIVSIPTGGVNPFPCKVFYVNKVHQMNLLWGTQGSPIAVEDPAYQIFLHLMLRGSVSFSVGDTRKFMLKLVGFRQEFNPSDVVEKFKSLISTHVKDVVAKAVLRARISFFEMNAHLLEISEMLQSRLTAIFDEYGVDIQYFTVESIDVPEKDYDAVKAAKERRAGRIIEGYTWQEERKYEVAKAFASNEGSMGNMGGMMGGMVGGAVMGGAMGSIAQSIMDTDSTSRQVPPHDVRSATGAQQGRGGSLEDGPAGASGFGGGFSGGFDVDSDFGGAEPARPQGSPAMGGKFCPECGTPLNGSPKFCPECGMKLARVCPACKQPLEGSPKFCPECGQRL